MEPVAIVILLALIECIVFGARVGFARGRTGIAAPAVSGNEEFERHFRVHYNTIEQLILFIPGIWFFGLYIDPLWAAGVGSIYLIGRAIYGLAYVKDPASRSVGMLMSVLPCWVLILGGLGAAIWSLIS
jgi:glutathione S-transferase